MSESDQNKDYDRYDRQMMLWGRNGQNILNSSHVCLVSHGHELIAMEILKSLILLGIGNITLVSDGMRPAFFEWEDLVDMNCDVHAHQVSDREAMSWDREIWNRFSIIVSVCSQGRLLEKIYDMWKNPGGLPRLVLCYANDRIGYVSLIGEGFHYCLDTSGHRLPDLWLDAMWNELQEFHSSFRLSELTAEELCKVPYTVLLVKALERLRTSGDRITRTSVAETIEKIHEELIGGIVSQDLNFKEAIQNGFVLSNISSSMPSEIATILENISSGYESEVDKYFVGVIRAVKRFVEMRGRLPVSGILPDMECSTNFFNMQRIIYERKSQEDQNIVVGLLYNQDIPASFIKLIVEHVRKLKVIELAGLPSLFEEYENETFHSLLCSQFSNTASKHGNPSVSAVIGGLASQECIKLLTHQYTPVENTLVYDASSNETVILKL